MSQKNTEFDFSLVEVVRFTLKWKWHIAIITVLSGIAAAVFSGPQFITPKFESKVVFYPTTINSISNAILSDATLKETDVLEFGEESEAEYALQILNSAPLMGKVVQRFDLMNHYEIDPNSGYPQTKLADEIRRNFNFKRTELLSIEISVLDKDPQMAADIANYISAVLDTTKTEIQRQVAQKAFDIIAQEYEAKQKEVENLQNKINQLTAGSSATSNPFARKNKKAARQDALSNAAELGAGEGNLGTILRLTEGLSLEVEQLQSLKKKYEKAKVDLEEFVPHHFEISPATPAERKTKPVRSLIVLAATGSGFLFALFIIIVLERLRQSLKTLKEEN
ncbi:MAG: hypothetical protein EP332_10525 [Bacteroidetes bacterium]|nr:MAG: hypothetical protein EP332_10525 [Bacteroidota bacterium]